MFLYHSASVEAAVMDSEGRCHRIPPNTPWEVKPQITMDTDKGGSPIQNTIPAEKVARQICDDGRLYGVVIVPEIRSGLSITFDVDSAARESTRIREQAETEILDRYVKHAKEEQLAARPVRPPSTSIQKILDARGHDLLRDYGLQPVGYKVSEGALKRDAEIAALHQQKDAQDKEIADLKQMITRLIDLQDKKKQPA